jgi:hypothetical protein
METLELIKKERPVIFLEISILNLKEYPYDETMQFDEFGSELESYQEGGEYELSDEEIDEIIRNGGEIEFI